MSWQVLRRWFEGRGTWLFYSFFILYFALLAIWGINRCEPWHDEGHFVETIKYFGGNFNRTALYNYEEMSTPLPFIIYAVWGKLVGFELPELRILSILIAFLSYLTFYILFKSHFDRLVAFLVVSFIALNPYFAGASLFVFTDMAAVLFLGLSFLSVVKKKPVLLGFALASALLSRQYLAFMVPSFFLFFSLKMLYNRDKKMLQYMSAVLISCIPLGLLMLFWGGSCPVNTVRNNYISYAYTFHPEFLTLYICQIFIYSFPFVLYKWKRFYSNKKIIVISFIASLTYFIFPVKPSQPGIAVNVFTVGYFHRLLTMVFPDGLVDIIFYLTYLLSLPVLLDFLSALISDIKLKRLGLRSLSVFTFVFYLIVMSFSYLVWEKYFVPVLPLVILLILKEYNPDKNAADNVSGDRVCNRP